MSEYSIFTSESVSEGHPDKMADQISDAVLDAILTEDKHSRVAVETMVKTGMAIIAGEVRTNTYIDLEDLVRALAVHYLRSYGYTRIILVKLDFLSACGLRTSHASAVRLSHESC